MRLAVRLVVLLLAVASVSAFRAGAPVTMTCSAPLSRRRAAAATFASLSAVASASAPAHAAAATEAEADAAAVAQVRAAYDGYAATYDVLNGGAAADAFGLPAMRLKLLAKARGRVLEVGGVRRGSRGSMVIWSGSVVY